MIGFDFLTRLSYDYILEASNKTWAYLITKILVRLEVIGFPKRLLTSMI